MEDRKADTCMQRKQDQDERDEHESLLDLYMRAMDAPTQPQAKAA